MYRKPKFVDEELGVNPFIGRLDIRVRKQTVDGQYYTEEGLLLPVERSMEYDAVCKLYSDADRRKKVVKLSARAKELMMWLMYEIEYSKDYVVVNKDRYMKESGVNAINTYRDALNDLIKNDILSKTVKNAVFWINPYFFFKGDRVAKYPDKTSEI